MKRWWRNLSAVDRDFFWLFIFPMGAATALMVVSVLVTYGRG